MLLDPTGEALMAFRTNYRFERAERDRVKRAKKEEKLLKKRQDRGTASPEADLSNEPEENTTTE